MLVQFGRQMGTFEYNMPELLQFFFRRNGFDENELYAEGSQQYGILRLGMRIAPAVGDLCRVTEDVEGEESKQEENGEAEHEEAPNGAAPNREAKSQEAEDEDEKQRSRNDTGHRRRSKRSVDEFALETEDIYSATSELLDWCFKSVDPSPPNVNEKIAISRRSMG